jgi:hypothetical protein
MAFPNHNHATRVLQELSPNLRSESSALPLRGPVLKVGFSGSMFGGDYDKNRELFLNNKAGDHVLRNLSFYRLTDQERWNYNWLRREADLVPKYKRYREGQGQKPKGNQDVWDDVREDLFFKGNPDTAHLVAKVLTCLGLVKFPPMGRDKRAYPPFGADNETYGRNEHIAFYINDILGEVTAEYLKKPPKTDQGKARKQVSSHLQVLKKMFESRPKCECWCSMFHIEV